jgi:hypothetical protein
MNNKATRKNNVHVAIRSKMAVESHGSWARNVFLKLRQKIKVTKWQKSHVESTNN